MGELGQRTNASEGRIMGQLNGTPIKDEATALASQVWCQPGNESREMDVEFAATIASVFEVVLQERENWIDTARQNQRNADFWERQFTNAAHTVAGEAGQDSQA